MFGIGPMELLLILVVALLVLGPKRMPELARTLGRGLSEFRRASNDLRQSLALDEIQNDIRDGLSDVGKIHRPAKRPDADDPPAQVGDDLPPGVGAKPTADEAEAPDEASGDAAPGKHPGELPEDMDPHAHHDGADEAEGSEADSALGSVPVGGRTPDGAVPAGAHEDPERDRG